MKKVLFVDQFGKTTGNDTLALAELINKHQKCEVSVYLSDNTELSNKNPTTKVFYGFKNVYSGNFIQKSLKYLKSLKELKKFIINNHYDVVHLQWFSLPWIERFYVRKLKRHCKIVVTVHDIIPFDNRVGEMGALKSIYKRANCLLLHTKKAVDDFNNLYNVKTPIQIITQGFCNKADYHPLDKKLAREHLNLPQDATIFLFYGTIRPSKGLDMLIEAVKRAHEVNNKVFILCAGAFHNVDQDSFVKIGKELADLNIGKFDFGFVPREEEQYYFSAADVLCLPYRAVTQSGVVQLGLMYELPIIATNVGSMDEAVINDVNGVLIERENVNALKDAIVSLCDDKKLKSYSKESKRLGETTFSLDKKAEKVLEAYELVLKK